jgi:hypothetical protein
VLLGEARRDVVFDELKRFEGAHLVYANVSPEFQSRIRDALGELPLTQHAPTTGEPLPPPEPGTAAGESTA